MRNQGVRQWLKAALWLAPKPLGQTLSTRWISKRHAFLIARFSGILTVSTTFAIVPLHHCSSWSRSGSISAHWQWLTMDTVTEGGGLSLAGMAWCASPILGACSSFVPLHLRKCGYNKIRAGHAYPIGSFRCSFHFCL